MPLPVPNLDDRRFQDLVDDAKRLVMLRCPEWTDHNVSDPGVTLIETFAFMTDQLLYRLNQVPDRIYLKFLDLIGLRMLPPAPARAAVTFWLSAPASTGPTIAAGTRVGTLRTDAAESTVFVTAQDLPIVPCSLQRIRSSGPADAAIALPDEAGTIDRTGELALAGSFAAFNDPPQLGDTLLLGLSEPVPGCAVRLNFRGRVEGVGVNPKQPPLVWEAWTGGDGPEASDADSWTECEVSSDATGGLNRPGSVIVHVPPGHQASLIAGDRAGWLRARIVEPAQGQPPYTASPVVDGLTACTVGGTVDAIHAEIVGSETLGESTGVPGQSLPVSRTPVLAGAGAPVVETSSADGWQEWTRVDHFADSTPEDRHFVLDSMAGTVLFGPAVRTPDGGLRRYGAVPEKGAAIRIREYATGGGRLGNVAAGAISSLRSSIPFVARVENRRPAHGGVDGETLEEAKERGPLLLRTRSRAVTAEDYETMARGVAPEAARIRCVRAGEADVPAGSVRLLVVPAAAHESGRILFESLVPADEMLARIAARLDEVRVIGAQVRVQPPLYRGVTVVARLIARPRVSVSGVRDRALDELYRYLNPLPGGGPDGTGWPFGRPVQAGDIFGLLQQVRGVELVEDVRLFSADPVTGSRGNETSRIDVAAHSLAFSFDHQVRVEEH
jgi:predicted phage baseplate assembly protein